MDTHIRRAYFCAVLARLGLDDSPWRRAFLDEWARWENTGAHYNPLATTQPGGEDPADPYWNTFGPSGEYHVRNYRNFEAGIEATATTLLNGYYPEVLAALREELIEPHDAAALAANIKTWGTIGFAVRIRDGWRPLAPPAATPPVSPSLNDVARSLANLNAVVIDLRDRLGHVELRLREASPV